MTRNVDPAEIERFEKLAASWWDPAGGMAGLHRLNPVRTRYIERAAGGLAGKKILDVGCGAGILSEALAARGAEVLGIDVASDVLKAAEMHAKASKLKIEYRKASAEALAEEKPGAFDLVTCLEMLEHVPDPERVVAACARLAKPGGAVPGGTVIFSTINRNPKAFLLAIVGAEYVLNIVQRGTHEYAKFIRPSELERWARHAGLEVRDVTGLRYNPLTRTASLSSDVDVNYLMHCAKT